MNTNKHALTLMAGLLLSPSLWADKGDAEQIKVQGGTGFPIVINNTRQFFVDENTVILKDGVPYDQLRVQGGTGFKIRYRIGNDVTPGINGGTATELLLVLTHKGPLLSIAPDFKIFNVEGLITADTFFEGVTGLGDLTVGQEASISGYLDTNSTFVVTRLEVDTDPLPDWKISGYVSALNATHFNLGVQQVAIGTATVDCPEGFVDGAYVEVKATPDPLFGLGDTLENVTEIACVPEELVTVPVGMIPGAVEGFVALTANPNQYLVGEQLVELTVDTVFENGDADDFEEGVQVEVEGDLDTNTGVLTATSVNYLHVRFKFEEPVLPAEVGVGSHIELYGRTILITPQLRDEDNILAAGLSEETQVEVRGFADSSGQLYATRVRDRGNPDANDVTLDGQITAISDPMLSVFDVVVDTSTSVFLDAEGTPLSAAEFFALIEVGTLIGVSEASANQSTQVVSGGVIQLDAVDEPPPPFGPTAFGLGIGTLTNLADEISVHGFE